MQIFFGRRLIIIDHFSVRQIFEAEVKRKISILQAGNNSRLHCQLQDPAWNVVNVVTGREWSPLILTTHSGRGCIIIMLHFMLFAPRAPQQCTPLIEKSPVLKQITAPAAQLRMLEPQCCDWMLVFVFVVSALPSHWLAWHEHLGHRSCSAAGSFLSRAITKTSLRCGCCAPQAMQGAGVLQCLKTTFPARCPAPRLGAASVAVVSSWSASEHVMVRRGEAGLGQQLETAV